MSRPKRAALYARVSTTGHGQDVGLQLDELREAARVRGWEIYDTFVDEGLSGAKTDRPQLQQMLSACQAGRVDVVACWKLDRLGRSLRHVLEILDQLGEQGVEFVSLRDHGLDTTTPSGRLFTAIIAAFAAFEREIIRERVIAGVRRAQAAGKHCGRPRVEMDLRPALAMLDQGHGLKTTAKALGVSRATLRRRLTEAGHWPRQDGQNPGPAEALHDGSTTGSTVLGRT